MTYRAFVALSGGGAKGIVHVGALRALEKRGVKLLGLSGSSAGSIVAALAAAGFTAEEMINTESGVTILRKLGTIDAKLKRATDLFGGRWWLVRLLRTVLRWPKLLFVGVAIFWFAPVLVGTVRWHYSLPHGLFIGGIAWLSFGVAILLAYCSLISGIAKVDRFRNALDLLLQWKMFPTEAGRVVLMGDFAREGRPSLKIVSANLTRRALHLFSPERTTSIPVADAVAASICLPVIFKPWEIGGELHVDGGIVSNLPAWPFDEERELDPEALTVAIEILDTAKTGALNRLSWPSAAVRTALFGSGELSVRVAGPAEHLSVPTRFELLDFDKSGEEAAGEVGAIAAATGVWFDKRLLRLPEIYRNACQVTQALVVDGLQISPAGPGEDPRVRVALGRLERDYLQSLRMSHSVGFDEDADEMMLALQGVEEAVKEFFRLVLSELKQIENPYVIET